MMLRAHITEMNVSPFNSCTLMSNSVHNFCGNNSVPYKSIRRFACPKNIVLMIMRIDVW